MFGQSDKMRGLMLYGGLFVLMIVVYLMSLAYQNKQATVIEAQLKAIHEQRWTEAYYAFTSKEFQTATSLGEFKRFLSDFPLFAEEAQVTFEETEKPGLLKAHLQVGNEGLNVQYSLVKVDKDWKIKGVEVLREEVGNLSIPPFDTGPFQEPIREQLALIKKGEAQEAYQQSTAEAFQASTPSEEFEAFVKDFPIMEHYKDLEFKKLTFNNNLGTYQVLLTANNGEVYELKYDLIKDHGKWKILQIQIAEGAVQ